MKLFKNLVDAVTLCLKQIMVEGKYSDKVLERTFKSNPQWGSRDRRFIAESVYDITRHFRYLSFIAGSEKSFNLIFAAYLHEKNMPLPEWPDYQSISTKLFDTKKTEVKNKAIELSYPDWLWNLCEKELGKEVWEKEAGVLNEQAKVVLRANSLKIKRVELQKKLLESAIETETLKDFKDALVLKKRQNVFSSPLFKEGYFEVQDAGSQLISEFLHPEPGQKVIDACAGGGGKSLHLSALMQNKGKIIAMDVEQWKLDNLKKRAKRAGAFNIEPRLIEGTKSIKALENSADRLLLDVPCSGSGVIKRNPDTKWKLDEASIEKTKTLQHTILNDYSKMLKSGGQMVYSTCSILPSENGEQVKIFLKEHSDFELLNEKHLLPSEGFDGFYMALLKRK
jgi:16S rRNA (cytosine967-C5)-methyltransferase